MYIIPRSSIEHFHGEPRLECACGLIVEHALMSCAGTIESKYTIYVAEELPHGERLVTIAHELIHLILVMQGFSLDSQVNSEQWIDEIAKRFYQENPGFLNWVYTSSARIAG
ncbi:MAG: hypothetical protein Q8P17_01660 [bacterium]|nr:hypothetical protein [bacterium]